ncbi:MAG: peroxide stress protein YaaA [Phycisphaerales bacterium]
MLVLLSPAKTLDFESPTPRVRTTRPRDLDDAAELVEGLRKRSVAQLSTLMSISDPLAEMNRQRFQDWTATPARGTARAAILAFRGDVYRGFDVDTLALEDFPAVQHHVRILSGLYGLLRPLDAMLPYRLEMGTTLKTARGRSLYEFWGDRITDRLIADIRATGARAVVMAASQEYARAVDVQRLPVPVITPVFRDVKDGKSRTLALFAKEARGMIARWVAEERATEPGDLRDCRIAGYRYRASDSTESQMVFSRPQPPPRNAKAAARATAGRKG